MNFGRSQVAPVERLIRDERLVTNAHVLADFRKRVVYELDLRTRASSYAAWTV